MPYFKLEGDRKSFPIDKFVLTSDNRTMCLRQLEYQTAARQSYTTGELGSATSLARISLQPFLSLITIVLVGRAFQILCHKVWVEIKEFKVNPLIFL